MSLTASNNRHTDDEGSRKESQIQMMEQANHPLLFLTCKMGRGYASPYWSYHEASLAEINGYIIMTAHLHYLDQIALESLPFCPEFSSPSCCLV